MAEHTVRILVLSGNKRVGKDTFANYLLATRCGWVDYALADPLKKGCKHFFMYNDEQLEDESLKEKIVEYWGFSPRQAFQVIGTELMRETLPKYLPVDGPEIWMKRFNLWLLKKISQDKKNGIPTLIVVKDNRYSNETAWFRKHKPDSVVISIKREGLDIKSDGHASEQSVKDITADVTVINNGKDKKKYHEEIEKCLSDLSVPPATFYEKMIHSIPFIVSSLIGWIIPHNLYKLLHLNDPAQD